MSQDEKLRALERELQRSGVDCIVLPKLMHEDLISFYANQVKHYLARSRLFEDMGQNPVYFKDRQLCQAQQIQTLHNAKIFYQRMLDARCHEVQDEKIKKLVSEVIRAYNDNKS